MIGIYKITNKINGKSYIGLTDDIKRRISEHKSKGDTTNLLIDHVIKKYGKNNFTYEILEECSLDQLEEREKYWIKFYNSKENGYNLTDGGDLHSVGENNGRAKLTEEDIKIIRNAYNNHERQNEVYKQFKDKVSFTTFQAAWQGRTWAHIMPEVFTEENKKYYIYQNSLGDNGANSILSDEEVILIRKRYVNETAKEIYEDYKNKLQYNTLQQILWGRTYKNLPLYKKKEKKWINI